MRARKALMTMLWRVQQAQMVIAIIFWSLTLTGVFYPYMREWAFNRLLGPENVGLGMLILFLLVFGLVILFGYLYDRAALWREQITVTQERNPFSYGGKMTPVQIIIYRAIIDPTPENVKVAKAMMDSNARQPGTIDAYARICLELALEET